MRLEYLGDLYYEKRILKSGFLCSTESGINDLKKKKIALFSSGEKSFLCKCMLEKYGINIDIVCENFGPLVGKKIHNTPIVSSYEVFGSEYHIILAVENMYINEVRTQLKLYGVKEYSVFFVESFHNFADDGYKELHDIFLNEMNQLAPLYKKGVPIYRDYETGTNLGLYDDFIKSSTWSHPLYIELYKRLKEETQKTDILEIGPGYGLLSATVKAINKNSNIDWVVYKSEYVEDGEDISGFFEYIKSKNPECRHEYYQGFIEDPAFKLEKKYDLILMTEVFEHLIASPIDTVKKMRDSLKPEGCIYLSTPNWKHLYLYQTWKDMKRFEEFESLEEYMKFNVGHNYQYNKDELEEIFRICGLKIIFYQESESNNHNIILARDEEK